MIALVNNYVLQISVNIVYFQILFEDTCILCGNQKKYVQFHNIMFSKNARISASNRARD